MLKPLKTYLKNSVLVLSVWNLVCCTSIKNHSKPSKWSDEMALSVMKRFPQVLEVSQNKTQKWDYKEGFLLKSYQKLYEKTHNQEYLNYLEKYAKDFINEDGSIKNYHIDEYNMDAFEPGKLLFFLYEKTKNQKYLLALQRLRKQLDTQPRTSEGGFWHKNIYPNQIWLDGLYMGAPFYAEYTTKYENSKNLDDVAKQFEIVQKHFIDKKTGLLYQCWDETKEIAWANKETGTSPTIWTRGIGWYAMALVDALDYFPKNNPKREELIIYLNQISHAIAKQQSISGLWYDVTDQGDRKGNYLESSCTAMLVYALAKGTNKGYLPKSYQKIANNAFEGLIKNFIIKDENGDIHIQKVSPNIGLGGKPFRDGSYEYYITGEPKQDSACGVAAFILQLLN